MGLSFLFSSSDEPFYLPQFVLRPGDGSEYHRNALISAFMFFQIFRGHFGIPLIQRHPFLINFCVTWFIYATSFTLLLYAGQTSTAGLVFVLHLWFSWNGSVAGPRAQKWRTIMLMSMPYIMFFIFSFTMVIVPFHPETVTRSRYIFYCTINLPIANVVPGTTAVILGGVMILEGSIRIQLSLFCSNQLSLQCLKTLSQTNQAGPPLHLFVRVRIFSAYSLLAFVGCIAFWSATGDNLPYLIQASLPTAAFLIFGTQAWGIMAIAGIIARPFKSRSDSGKTPNVIHVHFTTTQHSSEDVSDGRMAPPLPEKDMV
ncbi:hypothetical protein C8J57DRAFT_1382319 [Mycena rebaudengoi]|nr:hypothetical protein C8J57DRAFT_1382319 [Mycena rebaudengoi]